MQRKTNKSTIIIEDFNTFLSDQMSHQVNQKLSKNVEKNEHTINISSKWKIQIFSSFSDTETKLTMDEVSKNTDIFAKAENREKYL
jgi:hypothetical protein